jgi:hypothetical protein
MREWDSILNVSMLEVMEINVCFDLNVFYFMLCLCRPVLSARTWPSCKCLNPMLQVQFSIFYF